MEKLHVGVQSMFRLPSLKKQFDTGFHATTKPLLNARKYSSVDKLKKESDPDFLDPRDFVINYKFKESLGTLKS